MDCSPPGSSVHDILYARILEWVAISFSRGSSRPRDRTHVSCIGRWVLYCWVTRKPYIILQLKITISFIWKIESLVHPTLSIPVFFSSESIIFNLYILLITFISSNNLLLLVFPNFSVLYVTYWLQTYRMRNLHVSLWWPPLGPQYIHLVSLSLSM